MFIVLIYLLVFASIFLIALSFTPKAESRQMSALRLEAEAQGKPVLFKRPFLSRWLRILAPLNQPLVERLGRQKLDNRLLAANLHLAPEDLFALKEILLLLSVGLALILKLKEPLWVLFFVVLSFLGPDIWLKARRKKRQRLITRSLPDAIDLISLCVNAGLDFGMAVKWVVEKSRPDPLIEELNLFLFETKVGKSRREALQDMAKRVDLPEVHSFSRTLVQAERLGTSIEAALAILSEEVRDMRFRRGERLALQAPIKLLFPLIFFIMPVVGIIVGGPVILQFLQGGLPGINR